jgi:hypothetical protein
LHSWSATHRDTFCRKNARKIARWVRFAYWLMMFGYSDQAPGWLREATVGLDATFGFWCCG